MPPSASSCPSIESKKRFIWPDAIALLIGCAIFAGLSIFLAVRSESDLEADATTHFLMSRFAGHEHHYFFSVWGRPLCTAAYATVAWIGTVEQGRMAARFTSLLMAFMVVAITFLIARRQGYKKPVLAAIFLLAQPVFFLHSFSELTEIPFALVLMLAFLAYQRRRWLAMALLVALLPLGRPEGFGFMLMAAAALVAHRRARWLIVLPLPLLLWSIGGWYTTDGLAAGAFGWRMLMDPRCYNWVFRHWPYSYRSMYGRGELLSFVARLPVLVSPLLFPFTVLGMFVAASRWHRRNVDQSVRWRDRLHGLSHTERCEIWILLIPLSILIVHSLLWWQGLMGSNGELRYLVIVGPFFAMITARGWERAFEKFHWRRPLLWAGIAAIAPMSVNWYWKVVPLQIYEDGYIAREVARWYQADDVLRADFPRIAPTLPGVPFYMDLSQTDSRRMLPASQQVVNSAPPGALLVWDSIYGTHNSSAEMCVSREQIERAGWIHYHEIDCGDRSCEIYLSPRTISNTDTRLKYRSDIYMIY
jgi:hypothetical protein